MTTLTKLRGVVHGRIIELHEDIDLPEGTEITVDIAVPNVAENVAVLPPELEAVCGALADLGDEVDEFNRWYREARQADTCREIDPE
ncbi:MAG: hypothetical protein Q8K78_11810 [Planctomycetaceae bacterium]|nr:hypothetical protein [Planctomycetaceae bacterium]